MLLIACRAYLVQWHSASAKVYMQHTLKHYHFHYEAEAGPVHDLGSQENKRILECSPVAGSGRNWYSSAYKCVLRVSPSSNSTEHTTAADSSNQAPDYH